MEFFLGFHSGLGKYLIPVLAILGSLRALYGWLRTDSYRKWDRGLGVLYTSLLDVQLLMGFVIFFAWPEKRPAQWHGHLTFMTLAIIAAHVGSILVKRAKTESHQQMIQFFTYILSLALIVAGLKFVGVW
ncbi:hypothetical protein HYR54_12380 [Candidatus Acetothermia bacterium]|nr:hypothetical protein [Candidatus Acetothermia bacterium]